MGKGLFQLEIVIRTYLKRLNMRLSENKISILFKMIFKTIFFISTKSKRKNSRMNL